MHSAHSPCSDIVECYETRAISLFWGQFRRTRCDERPDRRGGGYFFRRDLLIAPARNPTPAAAPTARSALFIFSAAAGTAGPRPPPPPPELGPGKARGAWRRR